MSNPLLLTLQSWCLGWLQKKIEKYQLGRLLQYTCCRADSIYIYRVSHIETNFLNWLWQIEICKLEFVWRRFWNSEIWIFEFHQPVFKKVISADLNSLWQKRCRYQWKSSFFMIHSTKKDPFWSFDYQGVSNHQDQWFFFDKMRL